MPSSTLSAAITPETTIGELVAARPLLAAACTRRGLDVKTTIALLDSTGAALAAGPAEVDAAAMGLARLADHIETTHHAYLKAELPRLVEMADRVAAKHGWRDARLPEVAVAVNTLAAEMIDHMRKEEAVLFPLVRQIEAGAADGFHCGSIANPIRQMEAEHESAGRLTARLRLLTDGFTPAADDCNTHRALLAGLAEFEADLHRHVHKENNVLFPRALQLAGAQPA